MRVLMVTQIFPPEMGAMANRMYPIARSLAESGHQVSVATGMPNYPTGVVSPEYRGKRTCDEQGDGYSVLRSSYYVAPRNQSRASQLRSYLSFLPAAVRSGMRAGKVDAVFVSSPPLFPVISAGILARRWGAKLIVDLRDLWPDELVTYAGAAETSASVRLLRALERWTYRNADLVCATTQSLLETVRERGVSSDRAFYLPNGADLNLFRPLPRDNSVTRNLPLSDRFVVLYSGLLGIKHDLEVLLEAARLLKDNRNIGFWILGNGARREALIADVKRQGLDNVAFLGERRVEEVPAIIGGADLCYASVRPEAYPGKVISVKIFEYLACARAVVGSLNGESARIVEESRGGLVVPAGDGAATARAIEALAGDEERRLSMAANGRRYVEANYSRMEWASKFERRLIELWAAPKLVGVRAA